jgi:hypothetical protein
MTLNSKILGLLVIVILFGAIFLTTLTGWWQTESTRVPVKFEEGEASGEYDPGDIRGSYSFGDVSSLFNIPLEDLGAAFQVPQGTDLASFQLKSLEEIYAELPLEIGTASVRLFAALYNGLPYELTEETWLLRPAVEILESQGNLTPEQSEYLSNHMFDLTGASSSAASDIQSGVPEAEPPSDADSEHIAPEKTVVGSTTFNDLIEWGVSQSDIETVLGSDLPPLTTVIKDFVTSRGLQFSKIKTKLQELIPQ